MTTSSGWQQEGKARFRVDHTFYRNKSQVGRDLAVLAAAIYKQNQGQLRVIDAMSGCGIRPLRYHLEAGADWVWVNEGNPDNSKVLETNLAGGMTPRSYRITYQDANQLFFSCYQQRDYYDLVDLDNFGKPTPYVNSALWAVKLGGLLYLTSTDGRATSGRDPDRCLQTYGAYARSHPAVYEQGLRLLIGHVVQQAATRGFRVHPVFSLFNGQVNRVMVRFLSTGSWHSDLYGFVGYCHRCGHFQTVGWPQLGHVHCPCETPLAGLSNSSQSEQPAPISLSGPMWLGPLHDCGTLTSMRTLALEWGWAKRAKLLNVMLMEAEMPPYFYLLGDIGRLGQMDIPKRDRLIQALRQAQFQASPTHLNAEAIKTTATMADCIRIAQQLKDP